MMPNAHWSVTQAGLYDEKNGGRQSRWTVPKMFRTINILQIRKTYLDPITFY